MIDDQDIRERALMMAREDEKGHLGMMTGAVIERAVIYFDFIKGARDAEIISAARDLAIKISSADSC